METPNYVPSVLEDLLSGDRILRRALSEAPHFSGNRGAVIIAAHDPGTVVFLIHRGAAFRSFTAPDGRRTIVDVFLPTDIGGVDHIVMGPSEHEIVAASPVSYQAVPPAVLHDLMTNDRQVALRVLALVAEQRRRFDRHVVSLARFDARERICAFIVGVYDRLRHSGLIFRPTFNLPLNQDQLADHLGMTMVHINRTLRRLREERLLLVDRQVTMIFDVDTVRAVASGSLSAAALARPGDGADTVGDAYPDRESTRKFKGR